MKNLKFHRKIVKEVVEEYKKKPDTVAILLFGSLARRKAHNKSDVDIEVIHTGSKYKMIETKRYGIKLDIEMWPKKKLLERLKKKPYTCYPYMEEKILYDPFSFAKQYKKNVKKYFKSNKEVLKIWKEWTKNYLEEKKTGIKRTDKQKVNACNEFYKYLEKRFGK